MRCGASCARWGCRLGHPARRSRHADLAQDARIRREILAVAPAEVVEAYRARFIEFLNMNEVRAQGARPRRRTSPRPSPTRWPPSAQRPATVWASTRGAAPWRAAWCRIG